MDDEDARSSRAELPWPDMVAEPGVAQGREHLTIGEMQREFGLTQRALRFYEAKGLLLPERAGKTRLYSRRQRLRLALVLRARQLGFTLGEIRQMLDEVGPSGGEVLNISRRQCFEQIKLMEQRKREIESALRELRRMYSSFYARLAAGTA